MVHLACKSCNAPTTAEAPICAACLDMPNDLYRALQWSESGREIRERLPVGTTILAAGTFRFVSGKMGWRFLVKLPAGSVWQIVQFAGSGEFTVRQSVDTDVNRRAIEKLTP